MPGEWSAALIPIVRKFDIAAKFGQCACWNAEGSAALAKLLTEMALKLDAAVEMQLTTPPDESQ